MVQGEADYFHPPTVLHHALINGGERSRSEGVDKSARTYVIEVSGDNGRINGCTLPVINEARRPITMRGANIHVDTKFTSEVA